MKDFDVVIVGAGPGGIATAQKCAESKLKTLVLEKDQEIGEPKRCGEGLGGGWVKRLNLKVSKQWAVQDIFGAVLYSPNEKKLEIRMEEIAGYVIERKIFEKVLARDAARAGAKFITKANVFEVIKEKGKVAGVKARVMGEEKEFFCDAVVAADGVESRTARLAGLNTTNALYHVDSGFQYEMAGIDIDSPDLIHLYFGEKISPRGYVWVFPKGKDYANVGIGIAGDNPNTAKYFLDKWIDSHPAIKKGSIIEVNGSSIPVGGFLEKMTLDGLIVIGDAAHHVNPIHGGGMGLAMEAGNIAAEVLAEAKQKNDFSDKTLSLYTKKWYEQRGNQLKGILKKRMMFESMKDKDFETIVSALTGEDILKLASGEMMESAKIITKKLIRHPGLIRIMLKYLKEK